MQTAVLTGAGWAGASFASLAARRALKTLILFSYFLACKQVQLSKFRKKFLQLDVCHQWAKEKWACTRATDFWIPHVCWWTQWSNWLKTAGTDRPQLRHKPSSCGTNIHTSNLMIKNIGRKHKWTCSQASYMFLSGHRNWSFGSHFKIQVRYCLEGFVE